MSKRCIEHGEQGRGATDGQVLIAAARAGSVSIIEAMLGSGVHPDWRDAEGMTAAMHAASGGREAALRALVGAGADMALADARGSTALMMAALWDRLVCVKMLVCEQGCLARDAGGQSAQDWAPVRSESQLYIQQWELSFRERSEMASAAKGADCVGKSRL